MPENDMLKRLLDAGVAFTAMTQKRAEGIVRDLVKAGEVQAEQAQAAAQEIVERSRENTERMLETVRREIRSQVSSLGVATTDDIAALRREIADLKRSGGGKTAAKRAPARKTTKTTKTTKKAQPRKAAAKKATAS